MTTSCNFRALQHDKWYCPLEEDKALKRSYPIEILGKRIQIRTDDDQEYVQSISAYVKQKAAELHGPGIPVQSLMILTALNLADELFKERQRYTSLKSKIRKKSNELLEKLGQRTWMLEEAILADAKVE